jgi:hypothetical protein
MTNSNKVLSFCFFGRNDNYTPDFLYRLSTTINFLAHSAKMAKRLDAVEILIVDWASEHKLKDHVQLTADGAKIAQFIYVPLQYTKQHGGSGIPGNICVNIALKRAKGKLVGLCGAEVLIPASSLIALFSIIENKSAITDFETKLYVCGRYRLPIEWVTSQPSIEQWYSYLQLNSWRIQQEPGRGSFLTGNAGLFLIPKKMLHKSRGLLEALDPYWGWNDVEYTMRAISRYQCIDLNSSGVTVYDMEHFKVTGERSKIIKKQAKRLLAQSFTANDDNWGGGDLPVLIEQAMPSNNKAEITEQKTLCSHREVIVSTSVKNQMYSFCFWMAENLVELPDESELKLLLKLFNIVKNKNILYFKEYGINQGHSFYLIGFLFKQSTLIAIDRWVMGGGEHGPEHIAYNLTTPLMEHLGHIRLINKNLLTEPHKQLSQLENTAKNGLVLYRIAEQESFTHVAEVLTYDLKHHDVILIGKQANSYAQQLCNSYSSIGLEHIKDEKFSLLSHETNVCETEVECITEQLKVLISQGRDFSKLPVEKLYEKLKEVSDKKMIVWTNRQSIFEMILPHIKHNLLAIINDNGQCRYENVPVIEVSSLRLYPSILVIKLDD